MAASVSRRGGGGGGGGLLTTAGGLVFAGDAGGNLVAYDATTGKPLWHSRIGNVTSAPQTYLLDGRQYSAGGDRREAVRLYAVLIGPSQVVEVTPERYDQGRLRPRAVAESAQASFER